MKFKLFIIFLCIQTQTLAQTHLKGQVLDISEKPIPYANIVVVGEEIGTLSDSLGNFSLMIPKEHQDKTLRISAIGFRQQEFFIKDLSQKLLDVKLKPKTYELEEVVIDKEKPKYIEVGQTKEKSKDLQESGFGYGTPKGINKQIALFIPNDKNYQGYIKNVIFHFRSGRRTTPFRVRVYKVGKDGLPAEDLLIENVIQKGKRLSKKCKVDLSEYNLPIPEEGFFVAMEWIYDKRYEQAIWVLRTNENGKEISEKEMTFGQILMGVMTHDNVCYTYWETGGKTWSVANNYFPEIIEGSCHQAFIQATLEVYE